MIGFEEEFEVSLRLSEQEFSGYLQSIVYTDLDELSTAFANTKKPYRGHINFNRFKLNPIQGIFKKAYGRIEGEFGSKNGELFIRGSVISNKFLLVFIIGFTLVSFGMLTNFLISNSNEALAEVAVGLFFLIGLGNLIGICKSLKSQKSDFLDRLALIEKEKTPKSEQFG
ncbi:hypothetical protein [Pontibacter virosus]|uniref:Uncharacterized protein n=1 Tax=Pontibacter virosus TaxID=1765052 RepID=A0A2U1AXF1_9BACT|nr:hypothetical protein [Pontibacter virosus]PVY40927.1 hypothetical protein C8E01_106269 [Pontibacter virosus]